MLVRKVGFKVLLGVRRSSHYYNNERHDDIYMDIVKEKTFIGNKKEEDF